MSQSLQSVSKKVQDLEISNYISAYQQLIDSIGTPDESNFTDVFLFVDNDDDSSIDRLWIISGESLNSTFYMLIQGKQVYIGRMSVCLCGSETAQVHSRLMSHVVPRLTYLPVSSDTG